MSRNRFSVGGTITIDLSDGDWIEVLAELNAGESRQIEQCGVGAPIMLSQPLPDGVTMVLQPFYPIDWSRYEIERAAVWIKRWSFHDSQGVQRPVNVDTIRALDTDTFEEVNVALLAHAKELALKKRQRLMDKARMATPQPRTTEIADPPACAPTSPL